MEYCFNIGVGHTWEEARPLCLYGGVLTRPELRQVLDGLVSWSPLEPGVIAGRKVNHLRSLVVRPVAQPPGSSFKNYMSLKFIIL